MHIRIELTPRQLLDLLAGQTHNFTFAVAGCRPDIELELIPPANAGGLVGAGQVSDLIGRTQREPE